MWSNMLWVFDLIFFRNELFGSYRDDGSHREISGKFGTSVHRVPHTWYHYLYGYVCHNTRELSL